jgi:hypothetical protein
MSSEGQARATPPRLLVLLATLAAVRLAAHALFLPAYEGPDEMLHLGRVLAFAEGSPAEALRGVPLSGVTVASVRARPCGPVVAPSYGCPPYGSAPGLFNVVSVAPALPAEPDRRNPENNQPPLYYAFAGLLLRGIRSVGGSLWLSPDGGLLFARLLSAALAIAGVCLVAALSIVRESSRIAVAAFGALSLPGAADSLARCANDVAVFAWCALVLVALERRWRAGILLLLIACGPLLKLTALPVVVLAVATLWVRGARLYSVAVATASLTVFPVQRLLGWRWGGTWELNRPLPPLDEGLTQLLGGLAHSAYTLVKTTFWLGGWSFLRPPRMLVVLFGLLLLAVASRFRLQRPALRAIPHVAAAGLAAAGFVMFAVASRRFFGGWGGVGGWYVWGWFPWLLAAAAVLVDRGGRWPAILSGAIGVFAVLANVVYLAVAIPAYR